jgi:hypothetical protein
MRSKNHIVCLFFLIIIFSAGTMSTNKCQLAQPSADFIQFNPLLSGITWGNVTVVSDGVGGLYWNNDTSSDVEVAVDAQGNVHAVWEDRTDSWGLWGNDTEIMYAKYTFVLGEWSNITIVSDGYNGVWGWNDGQSEDPDIALDLEGNIHVVWDDTTDSLDRWGTDKEIMYAKYTVGTGWSNATVISDGYGGVWGWNNETSGDPEIAVDNTGNVYVVWDENTVAPGKWGTDKEVMIVNYSASSNLWSNCTVISDGYNGVWGWNTDGNNNPVIATDLSGNVHVAWEEWTPGIWGTDEEIAYVSFSQQTKSWSNVTIISDGYNGVWGWNDEFSGYTSIATDSNSDIHVVWEDYSVGIDSEIMYTKYTNGTGWSNATVISDGYDGVWGWNSEYSGDAKIAVSSQNTIHVVWEDDTAGAWGPGNDYFTYFDREIMHVTWTAASGWTNVSVLSDGYNGVYWNHNESTDPAIALDPLNGMMHVLWDEETEGTWGIDKEIFHVHSAGETDAPIITIHSPNPNQTFAAEAPTYNITINEQNLYKVWYTINESNIVIISDQNGTINQTLWDSLGDGQLILKFYANDTYRNIGSNQLIIIKAVPGVDFLLIALVLTGIGIIAIITAAWFYRQKNKISDNI